MPLRGVMPLKPILNHTQNSSLSSAVVITIPSTLTGILLGILVQAQTQNIRYTLDGTTPTASLGFQLRAGDPPVILPVRPGVTLTFIEEAASAVLDYQFVSEQ